MTVVSRTHCEFDFSADPHQQSKAIRFADYADRKIPELFQALGKDRGKEKIIFSFASITHPAVRTGEWTIQIRPDVHPDDLGIVLHEGVHCCHSPGIDGNYSAMAYLYEALADCYRITLSDDGRGDSHGNQFDRLPADFNPADPYVCGAEFIGHLRRLSHSNDFIRTLSDHLRSGDVMATTAYVARICGGDLLSLMLGYKTNLRAQAYGRPPQDCTFKQLYEAPFLTLTSSSPLI